MAVQEPENGTIGILQIGFQTQDDLSIMGKANPKRLRFAKAVEESKEWLATRGSEAEIHSLFEDSFTGPFTNPQNIAAACALSYDQMLTCKVEVECQDLPQIACQHLLRIWRYELFQYFVYLLQGDRLVEEMQAEPTITKLRIGVISDVRLSSYALNICFSIAVDQPEMADWMANRLAEIIKRRPAYLAPDALLKSKVAQFCFKLYERWRQVDLGLGLRDIPDQSVLAAIDATWEDEASLREALTKLCDFHVESDRKRHRIVDDGIDGLIWMVFTWFPVEILATLKVRTDLGMPLTGFTHPLLETPVATLRPTRGPFPHDPPFDEMRSRVEALLGPLQLPWE